MSAWQTFIIAILATVPALMAGAAGLMLALAKIKDVHVIVNQQRTDMMNEIEHLKEVVADLSIGNKNRGL